MMTVSVAPLPRAPKARAMFELLSDRPAFQWHGTGQDYFAAVLAAIHGARTSVELETYIWTDGDLARRLTDALIHAVSRGCQVRVLVDAHGSAGDCQTLAGLEWGGVRVRRFNPRRWLRLSFRNHRKLVVVDRKTAFVGGCNVADDYAGDGVSRGWRDLGFEVRSTDCVAALARSFEGLWRLAPFNVSSARALSEASLSAGGPGWELLCAGMGRGASRFRRRLHRDLARSKRIDILAAYFIPSSHIRRMLSVKARTGSVRVIVPQQADVTLAQWASRHVINKLRFSPIAFAQYVPSMLHAKLLIADDVVYVGSANLDARSLRINADLMLRIDDAAVAAGARALVASIAEHAAPMDAQHARPAWFQAWRNRLAYYVVAYLDPIVARKKLRLLG
jgi:cardiolipin synthase